MTTEGDDRLLPNSPAAAAAILAGIERDRARAAAALEPDARLLYATWGAAWSVGFGLMFAARWPSSPVEVPAGVAGAVFGLLLAAAVVVTAVHLGRTMSGLRGQSSSAGMMLGWAWLLGFGTFAALMAGAGRAGADEALLDLLWPTGSGLVVGLLYVATGAMWSDRVQFWLGAWILLSSGAGALAGVPGVYLVMSVAGGGGFLIAAAVITVVSRSAGRPR
jgi:hypothetical protein